MNVQATGIGLRRSWPSVGYTDLRGRFDYASLSMNDLDNVERFALLVMSDNQGAVVREVAPPAR